MFERFSEKARRVLFFARREAGNLGSGSIETEHLLLGLLRGDAALDAAFSVAATERVVAALEAKLGWREESIPSSVDLPVSAEAKQTFELAAEEAKMLADQEIECGHILLGMLRQEATPAAQLLQSEGITLAGQREAMMSKALAGRRHRPKSMEEPEMRGGMVSLKALVCEAECAFGKLSERDVAQKLKRKEWTRKEALGHLVDSAAAHQQWLAMALAEGRLTARSYPAEEWATVQQYREFGWADVVKLWVAVNRLLMHVLGQLTDRQLAIACRIGLDEPIPLAELMDRYVAHCEDLLGQILTRG